MTCYRDFSGRDSATDLIQFLPKPFRYSWSPEYNFLLFPIPRICFIRLRPHTSNRTQMFQFYHNSFTRTPSAPLMTFHVFQPLYLSFPSFRPDTTRHPIGSCRARQRLELRRFDVAKPYLDISCAPQPRTVHAALEKNQMSHPSLQIPFFPSFRCACELKTKSCGVRYFFDQLTIEIRSHCLRCFTL